MTPEDRAAADAKEALTVAINQLAAQTLTPLARIDAETRGAYFDLHNQVAVITGRLAREVVPQIASLRTTHAAIGGAIARLHQADLDQLIAPINAAAGRIQAELHAQIKGIGSGS